MFDRQGWRSLWVHGKEVFVSPEGVEYVRTPDAALAEVTITKFRFAGMPPLYLRRDSIERITKVADRKVRRLERRVARIRK